MVFRDNPGMCNRNQFPNLGVTGSNPVGVANWHVLMAAELPPKKRGVRFGPRPRLAPHQEREAARMVRDQGRSLRAVAHHHHVGRSTIVRALDPRRTESARMIDATARAYQVPVGRHMARIRAPISIVAAPTRGPALIGRAATGQVCNSKWFTMEEEMKRVRAA